MRKVVAYEETAALLDSVFVDSVPIARRLMSLLEQRGWTCWTKNRRITPDCIGT